MSDNIVKLERIKLEQLPGLKQMMHCYLEDLSKYAIDLEPKEDGEFVYDELEYYFSVKELAPFFVYCDQQIAGFTLVNSGSYVPMAVNYSIHEFYIAPDFRGRGVGSIAVNAIFDCFKGKYKIECFGHHYLEDKSKFADKPTMIFSIKLI